MDLQVNGRCVKVFNTQYTSKKDGQAHSKHHFVIEVQDGQFAKKICFTVMDEERWCKMGIVEGGTYNVSFDVSSREWNGNYYNYINAWRAVRVDNQTEKAPQMQSQTTPQPASGSHAQSQDSNVEYLSKKLWISDKKAREFMSKMGQNMVLKIKNSEKT